MPPTAVGAMPPALGALNRTRDGSAVARLQHLIEQILLYCTCQVRSRDRCAEEGAMFRDTVRGLRAVFDVENANEQAHIETMSRFPSMLNELDKHYYYTKDIAKTMIRSCQEENTQIELEFQTVKQAVKDTESSVYSAKTICEQQAMEIRELLEASKTARSSEDISEMRAALAELEAKNRRLRDETAALARAVSEMETGGLSDAPLSTLRNPTDRPPASVQALEQLELSLSQRLDALKLRSAEELAAVRARNEELSKMCAALVRKAENSQRKKDTQSPREKT